MRRKVTIQGTTWGFFTIEDMTEFHKDVAEDRGAEGADAYFRTGTFTDEEVNASNGKHFIFGHVENLAQSDMCPDMLYGSKEPLIYIVEDPDANTDEVTSLREQLAEAQADNDRLRDLTLHKLLFEDGAINMQMGGAPAIGFMAALIKFFEDNGGKNFLTMTVGMREHKYSIIIENLNGELSTAEKLHQLETQLAEAQQQIETLQNGASV